jgi:hypothetical protein
VQFFREHDSEPEAARLSSVKHVTAAIKVQPSQEFSSHKGNQLPFPHAATSNREDQKLNIKN